MYPDYGKALEGTRNLTGEARGGRLPVAEFRDGEVRRAWELVEKKQSVLFVGAMGVGKTAVVHSLAARAGQHKRSLRQLSAAELLVGTRYLGDWQTKLRALVQQARKARAILYFTDIWNLATMGRAAEDSTSVLDALRPLIEQRDVQLVGEVTPEVLRSMARTPGFVTLFEAVEIEPLTPEQADRIVIHAGERLRLELDEPTRRSLTKLTERFMPARAQPGPALALLAQVHDYVAQKKGVGEDEPVDAEFVEKVFSIYSGLPRFVVSRSETKSTAELRAWFQERIIGQLGAIEAVVEAIALFKAGLHDPARPIGTFLFVGPTGVGKTELARNVARLLFGSDQRLLRFDLSEFKDPSSFEMLVGNPADPEGPAKLLDPVRVQPFQVILLDEIEKAHPNVWDVLMPMLDEGRLTPAAGTTVSFRNPLIIATTNAGAQEASARTVGFGSERGPAEDDSRARKFLEHEFRPEFLNRFQHIAFFHALSTEQVRRIARQELERVLQREGVTGRNLLVAVTDAAVDVVIGRGVDPRYGARALKRELQRQVVLPIAVTLMEQAVEAGSLLRVDAHAGRVRVRVLDTPESLEAQKEREPVALEDGQRITRSELPGLLRPVAEQVAALVSDVASSDLETERTRLVEAREQTDFFADSERAGRVMRDLDQLTVALDRVDRLVYDLGELERAVPEAQSRRDVAVAGDRIAGLGQRVARAQLELVTLGRARIWDALLEIRPTGGRAARDLLVEVYSAWAKARHFKLDWLLEPLEDGEPVLLAIQGDYAFGLLEHEAGVHRLRRKGALSAATVRVVPWTDRNERPTVTTHRALKKTGQYGGKVRSRIECEAGLLLQNARTLAANRDLAAELVASLRDGPVAADEIVRRYDRDPFSVRDADTGHKSSRPDALQPGPFHALLCERASRKAGDG